MRRLTEIKMLFVTWDATINNDEDRSALSHKHPELFMQSSLDQLFPIAAVKEKKQTEERLLARVQQAFYRSCTENQKFNLKVIR